MSSTGKKMEKRDYTIRIAHPDDLPGILKIMRDNFYFEENMCKALCLERKITEVERKIITEISDESIKAVFRGSVCLVAVHDGSSKIIGANLTILSENPRYGEGSDPLAAIFPSDGPKSPIIEEYHKYLMDMNEKANLFNKYPEAKMTMEFYAIAVDKTHGRKGVARELMSRGISLAKERKIPIVFGVFTSQWSTKSAGRAGMKSILEIDLLKYKDGNGGIIFRSTVPHNIVNIMICEIEDF